MKVKTADGHLRAMKSISEVEKQTIRNMFDSVAEAAFNAGKSGSYSDYQHYLTPVPLAKPRKKYEQ